ncbi:MFS transporter [Methylobacterium sp. Leaf104]|uniref:MFS transporter n=1 Tax=Methylobacterium TaxID=407 RepID=UPI0006FD9061|nr:MULTISPECIES: MFS transporter [Methylobacterium]KQP41012.1 MFS transporter [Methylobacterium sp. Leaf104]MCI9882602.1 MFS transporter [Methylobacterium goesingense]
MTSSSTITSAAPAACRLTRAAGPVEARATRLLFLIVGFGVAAWAPLVPLVKARAGLDDGTLGLLLLCLGVGSLATMPVAGALAGRFGTRPVLAAAVLVTGAALMTLSRAAGLPVLAVALTALGIGLGLLDCLMNLQAVAVERRAARPMMSGFHGLYSLGCILGAAGFSALLSLGLEPAAATLVVVAAIAVAFLAALPGILATRADGPRGPAFALPRGPVLRIGLLCFVVFLTEGSALDWSGVFLIQERGLDPARAGLGYAAFSLTMTAGRLAGDALVRRIGRRRIVVLGALLAAAGLGLATAVPLWPVTLLGYALVGAGCANIVPVLFTAAGRQEAVPAALAIPAVTTLGYAGVLAGPAAIGLLAHATSLTLAFLAVATLLLAVAAGARHLRI